MHHAVTIHHSTQTGFRIGGSYNRTPNQTNYANIILVMNIWVMVQKGKQGQHKMPKETLALANYQATINSYIYVPGIYDQMKLS